VLSRFCTILLHPVAVVYCLCQSPSIESVYLQEISRPWDLTGLPDLALEALIDGGSKLGPEAKAAFVLMADVSPW
jgi:hypothetical protein